MRNAPRMMLYLLVLSLAVVAEGLPCPAAMKLVTQLQRGQTPDTPKLDGCEPDFQPELAKALAAFMIDKPLEFEAVAPRIFGAFVEQGWNREYLQLATTTAKEYEWQRLQRSTPRSLEALAGRLYDTDRRLARSVARFDELLPWLMIAIGLAVFLSVSSGVRELRPLFTGWRSGSRRTKSPQRDQFLQSLSERMNALRDELRSAVDELREAPGKYDGSFDALLERLPPDLDLRKVPAELGQLRAEVTRLADRREQPPAPPPAAAAPPTLPGDQLLLEREALAEAWKTFSENKDFCGAFDRASSDVAWQQVRELLINELPKYVPDDLKTRYDAALAPARECQNLVKKLSLIRRIVEGKVERMPAAAKELRLLRELAHLLMSTQTGTAVMERLAFRLEPWIEETFVAFADIYLQRYQEALIEGRHQPLEEGVRIVRRVLRFANLEPVELTLGQTLFDSTQHIGRSATSDARFPDGVIVAVVHNGFVHGGRDVIRQPEVIVNRMR